MSVSESVTTYPEGLSDKRQAATWLGVSVSWVEKSAARGDIPHTKVGGMLRFTADHLREIVAAGEVPVWRADRPAPSRLGAGRRAGPRKLRSVA